jgi:hypothetical protein
MTSKNEKDIHIADDDDDDDDCRQASLNQAPRFPGKTGNAAEGGGYQRNVVFTRLCF